MQLTELAREYGGKPAVVMAGSGAVLSYADLERSPTGKMLRRLLMDRYRSLPSA